MLNKIKEYIWKNRDHIVEFIKKHISKSKCADSIYIPDTGNRWGKTSLANIAKLNPDNKIRRFLEFAERYLPACTVTDTLRTAQEQSVKFKQGHSKLDGINKISKHQEEKAFDIVPYPKAWCASSKEWIELHVALNIALHEFNRNETVPLVLDWGGYWNTSKTSIGWDNAHYEVKK